MTVTRSGPEQVRRLVTSIPGPRSRALLAAKEAEVCAGVGAALPIFVREAGGGVLVDVDNNQLIDLGSGVGVTVVGNANDQVVSAIAEQASRFTHTAFFITPYQGYVEVCARLNRLTPGTGPTRSALFNSGAEAVENAVKVARSFTGRQAVVVLDHGYHGRTNLTLGMTSAATPFKTGFGPFAPEIYRVPASYPYRDGLTGSQAAQATIAHIERTIGAATVAAVVVEPVQGEGGVIVPAAGYLPALAEFCRTSGIVFVADEIQTGFCRTGSWFAADHESLEPDLITTGKGIAGGMPLAALTGRAEIMDAVRPGGLGGTYGGNPVACAAALAAIDWMHASDAPAKARVIGEVMLRRMRELQADHPVIGDIRGRGAMMALEVVEPGTKTPDPGLTAAVNRHCHTNGVVTLITGSYRNVIRFLPALTIPVPLLEEAFDVIGDAFTGAVRGV